MKFSNKSLQDAFRPRSFCFLFFYYLICATICRDGWECAMCDGESWLVMGLREATQKKKSFVMWEASLSPPPTTSTATTTHLGRENENIEFFRSSLIKSSISYTLWPKRARFFIWKFRSMCASRVDLPRMYFPSALLYIAEAPTAEHRESFSCWCWCVWVARVTVKKAFYRFFILVPERKSLTQQTAWRSLARPPTPTTTR